MMNAVMLAVTMQLCQLGSFRKVFPAPHGKPVTATLRENLFVISGGPPCQGFLRRSTDSGHSFANTNCVYSNAWAETHDCGGCRDTPVAVADERTGALFMLLECFVGNFSQVLSNSSYKRNYLKTNMWASKSTDFGVTFAPPRNITAVPPVPTGLPWTIRGTYLADSSGIQTHTGRLAVPGFVDVCFNDARGTCNRSVATSFRRNGGIGGQTPFNWAEMTFLLVSDDAGDSWRMTTPFAIYSGEPALVQLFDPPTRLGASLRIDGPMTSYCLGNASVCDTGWGRGATMQCGSPSSSRLGPAPHHCRGWMVSDNDGDSWYNPNNRSEPLFAAPMPDLPDPGCKGDVTRWEQGHALVSTNVQDNGDPGMNQYPRLNLTLSLSFDSGKTWPTRRVIFPATKGWSTYSSVRMTADQQAAVLFDTQENNHCRTQIRNRTCVGKLATVEECIACALAHKQELTTPYTHPPAEPRAYCPGVLGQYELDNMGGASGVQPNEQNFFATVTSACSEYSWPGSPDGQLLALIDPKEIREQMSK